MKSFAFVLLFCGFATNVFSQLTDSKWKNYMNVPDPTECILQFKKDTLVMIIVADGSVGETMKYSTSNDTLKITKLSGFSPCSEGVTGLYRFTIKDEKLTIVPLSDDCNDRSAAFKPEAWIREKN